MLRTQMMKMTVDLMSILDGLRLMGLWRIFAISNDQFPWPLRLAPS